MPISGLDILVGSLAILGSAVAIGLAVRRPTSKAAASEATKEGGRSLEWVLDHKRRTQIISNERLATLQRHQDQGGILQNHDLVIVSAMEFLDYDILFEPVRQNILHSVQYLYILDCAYGHRFIALLDALEEDDDVPQQVIKKNIDAVFVKPEFVLNNFVLMAAGSNHEQMYSALIFDRRPFAWLQQSAFRAQMYFNTVERLVKCVSVDRCSQGDASATPHQAVIAANALYGLESQIMGAEAWARGFLASGARDLDDVPIDLKNEVMVSELPPTQSVARKLRLTGTET